MSSFTNPHRIYLFDLKNGKKKLAYGETPEDALNALAYRLTEEEMAEILPEKYIKVPQRKLREHLSELG